MSNLRILSLLCVVSLLTQPLHAEERPNIIFFLSDDHRADSLGCAGHPFLKTPHLDQLAKAGTRYENAFVTTSICAASRASLFTGLFERTHGFTFGTPPVSSSHLEESYPVQLRKSGYRTGFVGKFGVKVAGGKAGTEAMFDSFVPTGRREKGLKGTKHFTDIVGDKAIQFIESNPSEKPFCLSVSFHAAHAEDGDKKNHFPHPQAESKLYEDIKMPRPQLDGGEYFENQPEFLRDSMNRDRYFWRWDTEDKYDHNLRNYFRMITGFDRNIGRVLDVLKQLNLSENTIVIFMGDNGYYMGERGFAGKWSHYEESLRVPLIVFDPRNKTDGRIDQRIALNIDISPTILEFAGITPPERCQGVSLNSNTTRDEFFCEHRMNHKRIPKWEGIRGDRYDYAHYFEENDGEILHDLKDDPMQLKNLVDSPGHQKILEKMRSRTKELCQSYFNAR